MKKLFSLVTLVFLAFLMVACDAEEYLNQIQELEETVEAKNNQIEGYELILGDKENRLKELEDKLERLNEEANYLEEIEALEETILDLTIQIEALQTALSDKEADIAQLQESLLELERFRDGYDGYFTITVGEGEKAQTRVVRFYDDAEASLWQLLNSTFNVRSIETEWGQQILGIDTIDAPFGSFIAFYINDEFAMTGVESTPYHHLDHFSFVKEWWHLDAQRVYEALNLMVENRVEDYLLPPNYHVIIGLAQLGILDEYTIELDETLPETVGGLVSRIFIENALGFDTQASTEALYEIKTIGHLYTTSLVYAALKTNDQLDLESFEADLRDAMATQNLSTTDLDTLSMMLIALSLLNHEETNELIGQSLEEIEQRLYTSEFGDNAATFANVIIGLLSVDKNPMSARYYNSSEESLLEVFISFQNPDGTFNWTTEPDAMFSTPQAFLALVMLDEFILTNVGTNPYIFD